MPPHLHLDPWAPLPRDRTWLGRLTAVGEPLGLLLGGILAARLVFAALGGNDANQFLFPAHGAPDFLAAAFAESAWHLTRYGLVIGLVILMGAIRGRRTAAAYAVSLGDHSAAGLIVLGVVLGAVVSIPTQLLMLIDRYVDLGPGTPFWGLMAESSWTPNFWFYMAVSSFGLVPFVEELVARGYMLGRLRESFSPAAALMVMGFIFALAHGQYHQLNVLALGQLASITFGSVIWGYAVFRTGSLLPAIVAHAFVNVPTDGIVAWTVLVASATLLVVTRRAAADWLLSLARLFKRSDDLVPALVLIAAVAVSLLTLKAASWAPYAWLAVYGGLLAASVRRQSVWRSNDAASR